jgi:cobalt-zinc-cadmium efflux system outer membrane protein
MQRAYATPYMLSARRLPLLLWAASFAVPAFADSPPTLTLAEARAVALQKNWDLLAAKSDLDLAEAQRLVASAFPNPEVQATLEKLQVGRVTSPRTRDGVIALTQLLEIGGKRGDRIRSAAAGITSARAQFEFARARLDAAVVKAYVAARVAEENVRIGRGSTASLGRSAEIAGRRFEAGEISAAERDQVEIAAGRFRAETHAAESALVRARTDLETLLGLPRYDADLVLADDLPTLLPLVARLGVKPSGERVDARGDVRAAAAAIDGAEADLSLQKALRIPDPTVLVQYERDLPDTPNSVGVGVSLPVPLFNHNNGGVRAAEVARDSAQRRLAQARAEASAELAAAQAALDAAQLRRELLDTNLLPRAVKVQETVAFAYDKGGASLLELLEAERNLNELRLAALGSEADLLSAAADLAAARGETLP